MFDAEASEGIYYGVYYDWHGTGCTDLTGTLGANGLVSVSVGWSISSKEQSHWLAAWRNREKNRLASDRI